LETQGDIGRIGLHFGLRFLAQKFLRVAGLAVHVQLGRITGNHQGGEPALVYSVVGGEGVAYEGGVGALSLGGGRGGRGRGRGGALLLVGLGLDL